MKVHSRGRKSVLNVSSSLLERHFNAVDACSLLQSNLQHLRLLLQSSGGLAALLLDQVADGEPEVDGVPEEEGC